MVAIETHHIAPSNTLPARIKATSANGQSITLRWDHSMNGDDNHKSAALALVTKLEWNKHGGRSIFVCQSQYRDDTL